MATSQSFAIGRDLHQGAPDVSVIGLGVGDSDAEMLACAEVGITGFVTPHASLEELVAVVKKVAQGEAIYSPQLAGRLVRRLAALSADQQPAPPQVPLTIREREIAALLEQHLSNKEIATTLGIEVATVKNHIHNLLHKLNVRRRFEAVQVLSRERRTLANPSIVGRGGPKLS
jgi:DNA-binding NarL/FixJ family response regulator